MYSAFEHTYKPTDLMNDFSDQIRGYEETCSHPRQNEHNQFLDHLADDVLPALIERLSTDKLQSSNEG